MIKHGKIYPFDGSKISKSHLDPIAKFVTKGIADAKEPLILQPMACDVKGAKKFDGQQCVIAKALTRTLKPEAVAIGRTLAYAVFGGLAIRFTLPKASRSLVDEFDSNGRVRKAPIELCAMTPSWRYGARKGRKQSARLETPRVKRARTKRYGVRAIGGGVTR